MNHSSFPKNRPMACDDGAPYVAEGVFPLVAVMRCALLLALTALLAVPAAGAAAPYVPGEVVVRDDGGVRTVSVPAGETVPQRAKRLRERAGVDYAVPNFKARAAAFVPDDPGIGTGWQALQWNFLAPTGVNAPDAWSNLIAARAPGGRGTVVAVLDSGVAYENRGRFRRSPDFSAGQFVRGYDFVDDDPHPNDEYGHGTFVSGIIAERTDNAFAVTGLAYGAKIMPVRVLDRIGEGDAATIARGIRFAVRNGADAVNLSLVFSHTQRASGIPQVLEALRYARRNGVFVTAPSGNDGVSGLAYPARASNVVSVGATTRTGCLADYSNTGRGLDLVAPGGGPNANFTDDPQCTVPDAGDGSITQLGFTRDGAVRSFGYPANVDGTSFASPHVAAIAALVEASGVIGEDPSPGAVLAHLRATARDLGRPGIDRQYGAGLVDAAAATRPLARSRRVAR